MDLTTKILAGKMEAEKQDKIPAFAYDRVSTEEQTKGLSLEYQKDNSNKYADQNDLHIIHTFSSAESAFKEGRKNFNKMLNLALQNNIKHIIFKNTDRLGRNDVDWPRCKNLARTKGFHIHLYELSTIFNINSTAEEEMFLDNTASMAKYWSNKISQGVKNSNKHKIENGIAPMGSRPPFGYVYDKEKHEYVIDTKYETLVKHIHDTYDNTDISCNRLAEELNKDGFKTPTGGNWSNQTIYRLLQNNFYIGEFTYKGEAYTGKHKAYISKARYKKRIEEMANKNVSKNGAEFLFKGLLVNKETGRRLTGSFKKGAHNSGEYVYYVHNKPYSSFKEESILNLVNNEIKAIMFTKHFANFLKDLFKIAISEKEKSQIRDKKNITKEILKLEKEQDELLEKLIAGFHTDTVKRRMDLNLNKINRLKTEQQEMNVDKQDFIFDVSNTIETIREFPKLYQKANLKEKSSLLKKVIKKIEVNQNSCHIEWKKPYGFILEPCIKKYFILPNAELSIDNRVPKKQFMGASIGDLGTHVERITAEYIQWLAA